MKDLDIVIYGATGFTGRLCVDYLNSLKKDLKWAIAGRNEAKLNIVNAETGANVEVLVADSDDRAALEAITARAKVVLSTAGPFHRYGSNLVAACVKNVTHYVDITGENFWVKGLIEKHHAEAAAKGVRIIPSCGFDSIPSDLGSYFSVTQIDAPIKRIESFHSYQGDASGGTLETIFAMPELNLGDDLTDPFLLNPTGSTTPEMEKASRDGFGVAKKAEVNGFASPFIMAAANTRVVRRSAALLGERQEPYGADFVYLEFAYHPTRWRAIKGLLGLATMGLVVMTPLRKLVRPMLKQPGEGPSQEERDNGWFDCKFIVETDSGDKYVSSISGDGDPGYKVTSKLVTQCALCLLEDSAKLPGGDAYGGVLTSASGLGRALIERLSKVGIRFNGPHKAAG
jgi:short subunit dehydrogenase-like uncharacterized protein